MALKAPLSLDQIIKNTEELLARLRKIKQRSERHFQRPPCPSRRDTAQRSPSDDPSNEPSDKPVIILQTLHGIAKDVQRLEEALKEVEGLELHDDDAQIEDGEDPVIEDAEVGNTQSQGLGIVPISSGDSQQDAQVSNTRVEEPLVDEQRVMEPRMEELQTESHREVPMFKCKMEDLGRNMVRTLTEFARTKEVQECGVGLVQVVDLPRPNLSELSYNDLPDDFKAIKFSSPLEGSVKVMRSTIENFGTSDFTIPELPNPSHDDAKKVFESTVSHPPDGSLGYFIGTARSQEDIYESLLDSGEVLREALRNDVSGVTTNNDFWSVAGTRTATSIHQEDLQWPSVNLMVAGESKAWLTLEPDSVEAFEKHMRRRFPKMPRCSQFVRHLGRLVSPSLLDQMGVKYRAFLCRPGYLVFTLPRVYHQIVNLGNNFAKATNFNLGEALALPKGYMFCTTACGGAHTLTQASFRNHEQKGTRERHRKPDQAALSKPQPPPKRKLTTKIHRLSKRRCSTTRPDINGSADQWIAHILAFDQSHRLAAHKSCKYVASIRLAGAVLSTKTAKRCILLLENWRDQALRMDPFRTTSGDWVTKAAMFAQRSVELETDHKLNDILSRLAELRFASEIDSGKAGALRNDSGRIDTVLKHLERTKHEYTRTTLHNKLRYGRKLQNICGPFGTGLLCLMPFSSGAPYHVTADLCHKITDVEIREFQHLIGEYREVIQPLCDFGSSLLDLLLGRKEMEFECERRETRSLDKYTEADLLLLLKPVRYLETNLYDPTSDWPKPDNWPWSWPADPTSVPSDYPCDLCNTTQCDCISSLPTNRHRICDYGRKGRGIQALAPSRGGLSFKKGEYIGELTGEIVPPATYDNSMVFDFCRADLPEEPIVCQIYCGGKGNWVRLINHSCNPCARFVTRVVSGKARTMLQASRDIYDGMEMTANYGSGRLKGNDCLCEACEVKRAAAQNTTNI